MHAPRPAWIAALIFCLCFLGGCGSLFKTEQEREADRLCVSISNIVEKNYRLGFNLSYLAAGLGLNFERSGILLSSEAVERQKTMRMYCEQWVAKKISDTDWLRISRDLAIASSAAAARNPSPEVAQQLKENLEQLQELLQALADAKGGSSSAGGVISMDELKIALAKASVDSDVAIIERLRQTEASLSGHIDRITKGTMEAYGATSRDQILVNDELRRSLSEVNKKLALVQDELTRLRPPPAIPPLSRQLYRTVRVSFSLGRAELAHDGIAALRAAIPPRLPDDRYQIELNGYTDMSGSSSTNAALSLARAESVRDFLVDELKLESRNIAVYGRRDGVTRFGADASSNRIVELKLFLFSTNPASAAESASAESIR